MPCPCNLKTYLKPAPQPAKQRYCCVSLIKPLTWFAYNLFLNFFTHLIPLMALVRKTSSAVSISSTSSGCSRHEISSL